MKIVLAPDSFKGCLSAGEVASAMERGLRAGWQGKTPLQTVRIPVADGGEGTVSALCESLGGNMVSAVVQDPLGRPVKAEYCICGDLAVIESAAACGLTLLEESERNPLKASTRGLGELILDALSRGCTNFIIGLGGSATNDGGRGLVETPGLLGCKARFTVACDVDTPYIGPEGASRVFGPQKGASPEDVEILEKRLTDYAKVIFEKTGKDVRNIPGAGAAGGLGGALLAFFGAELKPGAEIVLEAVGFDAEATDADLVITGEGCSDFQTPKGKTPAGVLARSKAIGVPAALLSGSVKSCPELLEMGFSTIMAATPEDMPPHIAMVPQTASALIEEAARKLAESLSF